MHAASHSAQDVLTERRFTEDEVRRILTNAVEVDAVMDADAEGGLTLAEIQRVATEAGLSPASVTAAVAALDAPRSPPPARVLGLPIGVASTVVLPGAIEDAEWRRLVAFLQDTFEAQGREERGEGRREWRNGNLRIAVEQVDGNTVLQLRTRKESARSLVRSGGSLMLGSLVVSLASTVAQSGVNATAGVLAMGIGGAVMAAMGALQLPGWSAARQKQFQAVAEFARRLSARRAPTLPRAGA